MEREPAAVVGREEELAALAGFLDALDRLPGVLLLRGEAGIGKTTLWRAGIKEARLRTFRVLAASPAEAETKLAFASLGDLLEDAVEVALPALPSPQRRALEVALLLEESAAAAPEERTVAVAFLSALRALAARSRLLVAVDDVQWLDAASREVLAFAVRRLRDEPIALLLAHRTEGDADPPLGVARAIPDSRIRRIDVGPLSLGALHRLVRNRLGTIFARPTLRKLNEASGGNPFFALEIGRALAQAGTGSPGDPLPVPTSLYDLVRHRLAALPAPGRRLLPVVAALSAPTVTALRSAAGRDEELVAGLDAAVAVGILERDGDRLRFTHPLLASVAYAALGVEAQRRLHRRLAEIVDDPEQRAHHLALATDAPDEEVASNLELAARRAFGRGATDAAADLYAWARRLTPPANADELRARTVAEAECCLQGGDTPRAKSLLAEALTACEAGQPRAEVLRQMARVHSWGLDWRTATDYSRRALSEAGDDLCLRMRIELEFALTLDLMCEDVDEIVEHARAAARLAETVEDDAVLAEALAIWARAEMLLGRGVPTELVERALALEPVTKDLPTLDQPRDYLAVMRGWGDEFEEALATLDAIRTEAAERGEGTAVAWTLARMSHILCLTGAWEEALEHVEHGYELALEAGQVANQAVLLASRALVEAHFGRPGAAREAGQKALTLATGSGAIMARRIALSALGLLELSLGRPGEAHDYLAPLVAETRAAGVGEPGAIRFVTDDVEALIALGRLEAADALLDWYEQRSRSVDRASALARSGRCRGLLAAARAEPEPAIAAFESALAQHEQVPIPLDGGRTLFALGSVQRRARRRRDARGSLEEALAVFECLRAASWASLARAELAQIGGRAPSRDELTPAEQRVAQLVAEGLTNREVASSLFLSQKTVEFHLRNVFRKLGVRSRAELARRFTEEARGIDP